MLISKHKFSGSSRGELVDQDPTGQEAVSEGPRDTDGGVGGRSTEKQRGAFSQAKTGHWALGVIYYFGSPACGSADSCAQLGLGIWTSEAKTIERVECPGSLILGVPMSLADQCTP